MTQAGRVLCTLLCALATSSCLIDDECDAHQTKVTGLMAACVCDPGYVVGPEGYGCVACGKNEEAKNDECVCKEGFSRTSETADCVRSEAGAIGSECTNASDCGEDAPICAESKEPAYCTPSCERSSDCPESWRCATSGDEPFCEKAPAGYGMACASSADCTDPEASYCEAIMLRTCMIDDCVAEPGKCLSGTVCCDLTALINVSLCIPESTLANGKCIGGAEPISP